MARRSLRANCFIFGAAVVAVWLWLCKPAHVVTISADASTLVSTRIPTSTQISLVNEARDTMPTTTNTIPKNIYVLWRDSKLFFAAAYIDEVWRAKEPHYSRRVVNDSECRELASRIPDLLPKYDHVPLNVMRADICRVLVIYFYGGIYMDLDVSWVRPLDEWLDSKAELLTGYENSVHVCNWFFAARRSHPCLRTVIDLQTRRIFNVTSETFSTTPHLVHVATGPGAFTDGLAACDHRPRLSPEDVGANGAKGRIQHLYGSQGWKHIVGYSSWTKARMQVAGWSTMFSHYASSNEKFPSVRTSTLDSQLDVIFVAHSGEIEGRSSRGASAELAIDGDLQTISTTTVEEAAWWQLHVAQLLRVGKSQSAKGRPLACVKVFAQSGSLNLRLLLIFASRLQPYSSRCLVQLGVTTFVLSSLDADLVTSLRLEQCEHGSLSIAEVRLFSDDKCSKPYRLAQKQERWEGATKSLFHLLTNRTSSCTGLHAVSQEEDGNGRTWYICATPNPCAAVVIGNEDFDLGLELVKEKCVVRLFGDSSEYPNSLTVVHGVSVMKARIIPASRYRQLNFIRRPAKDALTLVHIFRLIRTSHLSILKIDLEWREWDMAADIVALAARRAIDQLLMEVRFLDLSAPNVAEWMRVIPNLLEFYHLVHFLIEKGVQSADLTCIKLTFVRKGQEQVSVNDEKRAV